MSTKAYYPINEIGAGKPGFAKTRSIIEAAFYGNNVVKVNTLKEAYELAKNSPGTIVTDMPVYRGEEFGLEKDAKVLLFNDGAITGRYAGWRVDGIYENVCGRECHVLPVSFQGYYRAHSVLGHISHLLSGGIVLH